MTAPTSPSHPFAGTVTHAEFARIQHRMQPVWARWYVLYPVLAAIFLACTLPGANLVVQVTIDAVLLAIFAAAIVVATRRARARAWRQAMRLGGRVHGAISPAGIEWNTERSSARYEWAQIARIDQGEGLTLAFFQSRGAFYFPRSFFASDAAWAAFNEAISGYVTRN